MILSLTSLLGAPFLSVRQVFHSVTITPPKIGLAVFPLPVEEAGWNQDSAAMGIEIDTINLWVRLTRLFA